MRRNAGTAAKESKSQRAGQRRGAADLKSSVQSLAKGFRVLESFSTKEEELTLSEIADAADLDAGTTYRMLNTLVDLGYVARVPESRRFRLTLKILDLGFHALGRMELRTMVRPILRSLVGEVSEAASFGVLDGADILYIERVRAGLTRLGVDIRIGTTIPASISVIGRAMLAFLPEATLDRILSAQASHRDATFPVVSRAKLLPNLQSIRACGYALQNSMISGGLRVLAVPVLDRDAFALGAISIAAPTVRCSEQEFERRALVPLGEASRQIARALEANGSAVFSLR
jgi:IclR family pca regulon transcriptional regulator